MTPLDTLIYAILGSYLLTLLALIPVKYKLDKLAEAVENLPSSKKNGNTYGDTK